MGLKRQIQLQEVIKNDKKKMQKWLEPVYIVSEVDSSIFEFGQSQCSK